MLLKNKIVLGFFGVCVVIACVVIVRDVHGEAVGLKSVEADAAALTGVTNFDELSNRLTSIAEDKGALYAFDVLRSAQLPPQIDFHLLGHVVGDELYKQEGMNGIIYCTDEFRNACSHSIVIGALNEYGEAALDDIREACREAPGGGGAYTMCYHGLGHGVFSYFAFQFPETVEFCKKTGTAAYNYREYVECVGGAVMELMGGGGHDQYNWSRAREQYLDGSEPLSLCLSDTIPDEAKGICLVYITPHIWKSVGIELGNPDPSLLPEAFAVCEQIPVDEKELRRACFGGFGKEFVPILAGRDTRTVDKLPDAMYGRAQSWCMYAEPMDGKVACISDAVASLFWGGENDPDASFRFCSLVQAGEVQDACWDRLAADIGHFVRDAGRRESLCSRLPERSQAVCSDL